MIEVTAFAKAGGPPTKSIRLDDHGKPVSDASACRMAHGEARRVRLDGLPAFGSLIHGLASHEAIALGALRNDLPERVSVATKARVKQQDGEAPPDLIGRTASNVHYRSQQPALALIDVDSKGMPQAVADCIAATGDIWKALVAIIPELEAAGRVIRPSTSSGLYHTDTGEQLPGSRNQHIYVPVADGADIDRFLRTLHDRCWLAEQVKQHGSIPPQPMTQSGGGGYALCCPHRGEPIHGATGWPAPGICPRRGRLSVIIPPSTHISTRLHYVSVVVPWVLSPPDAPIWWLHAVAPPPMPPVRHVTNDLANADLTRRRRYAEAALRNAIDSVASANAGQRNATLNKEMFGLVRLARIGDLTVREIADCMTVAARHAGPILHRADRFRFDRQRGRTRRLIFAIDGRREQSLYQRFLRDELRARGQLSERLCPLLDGWGRTP